MLIQDIETKFPKPKECPDCNTKCAEMKCPDMKCPDMKLPDMKQSDMGCPSCNHNEPENSNEPETSKVTQLESKCPSVQDIVSGIFPGRNPKVVDGGRYFSIDPYNTYDGLSTSNFYEHKYDFPMQQILKPDPPLRSFNIGGEELINNSKENNHIDTSKNKILNKNIPVAYNFNSPINYLEANHKSKNIPALDHKDSSIIDKKSGNGDMRDYKNIIQDDGLGSVNISGRHSLYEDDDEYDDDDDDDDDDAADDNDNGGSEPGS